MSDFVFKALELFCAALAGTAFLLLVGIIDNNFFGYGLCVFLALVVIVLAAIAANEIIKLKNDYDSSESEQKDKDVVSADDMPF